MKGIIKEIVSTIKEEIKEQGFNVVEIILFGSRARGEYQKDSDWDVLVLVDRKITFKEKKKITARINRKLAEKRIPCDVILKYIEDHEKAKEIVGNISYFANKGGVRI